MGVINALARDGIYVGNASSCSNEALTDKNIELRQKLYGESGVIMGGAVKHDVESDKRYIRLSFNKADDFTMETLERIAETLNSVMHSHD
jgi:hypothetical protein